jgi:hypothetical protein
VARAISSSCHWDSQGAEGVPIWAGSRAGSRTAVGAIVPSGGAALRAFCALSHPFRAPFRAFLYRSTKPLAAIYAHVGREEQALRLFCLLHWDSERGPAGSESQARALETAVGATAPFRTTLQPFAENTASLAKLEP